MRLNKFIAKNLHVPSKGDKLVERVKPLPRVADVTRLQPAGDDHRHGEDGFSIPHRAGMTMTSGTSTGRKGLICERRETSLVGGHAIRGVQFKSNMDLGSGDTSDYYTDIQNNHDSLNWDARFESHDFQPAHSAIAKTSISGSASIPPPPLPPPTPPGGKGLSSSSESLNKRRSDDGPDDDKSDVHNLFKGNENQYGELKSATLAVVEDNKQPSFTANESNPTVPAPTEPSKTSTLRLSDRTRSESEDDIEKMDEPEQDGTLIGHKTLYKSTATTENSPNSEKIDKNGNRSEVDQNEADNDCVVQCLYYTIQCCECVIF